MLYSPPKTINILISRGMDLKREGEVYKRHDLVVVKPMGGGRRPKVDCEGGKGDRSPRLIKKNRALPLESRRGGKGRQRNPWERGETASRAYQRR